MATPRQHTCKQESAISALSTHMVNQSNFDKHMEIIIEKLVETHNTDKLETRDMFSRLSNDVTKIGVLLTELTTNNQSVITRQKEMSEDLMVIKSKIQNLEYNHTDTKKELSSIKDSIAEQDKDTMEWHSSLSRRISRLEKLSYWIYAVGTIIVGGIVFINTCTEIYCKLNK